MARHHEGDRPRHLRLADVLELRDVDTPEIADDEVLVRVQAAGVDRGVWHVMTGLPYPIRLAGYGLRAPKNPVLGMDVAGVVEAVGNDVTRFQPGDEVFGIGNGAFAEYACAPRTSLRPSRRTSPFEQAAVVAISGLARPAGPARPREVAAGPEGADHRCVGRRGDLRRADREGVRRDVTGVCSTTKVDMVRSIGADHVIDYTQDDFAEGEQRYDVILDIGGNRPCHGSGARWPRRGRSSSPAARPVDAGSAARSPDPGAAAVAFRGPEAGHVHLPGEPRGHDRPQGAHRSRARSPRSSTGRYALSDVPEAIRYLERGRARGKLVISV